MWQCRQMSYCVGFVQAVGRQNGRQSAGLALISHFRWRANSDPRMPVRAGVRRGDGQR
jgi:hypothetical protein